MKLKRSIQGHAGVRGHGRGRLFVALVALASGGACSITTQQEETTTQREETVNPGGTTTPEESPNAGGVENVAGRCEVTPPFRPSFEPEVEWAWTGGTVLPTYKNVMMTPVVVDVDGDKVSDVVFNSYAGTNYETDGILRAISGANGRDLWAVTDPAYRVRGAASIAAGDIDNDGKVEICTAPENGVGMICFENDGTFKFRTSVPNNSWGGPSFADLDGDGSVEIINGSYVFTNTGVLKWSRSTSMGGTGYGPISYAADIDQDGLLEVVNDRVVYRHDGTVKCYNLNVNNGLSGVANFDSDPYGEIALVGGGNVYLLDDNCAMLWSAAIPGGLNSGYGGAPNIADFDNDGQVEIGVAGASSYAVFETNGTLKWSSPTRDVSSNRTGSSTFDFEGDGKSEVVYADEQKLRIYDGATGAVRFEVNHSSCTTYENPVIVDVDGDDNAEIVVAQNNGCGLGNFSGIRVFRDKNDGWVNTRRIWNQHAYSVTNVNDDGTIPTKPATNWRTPGLNTFRSNSQGVGTTSPFAASDLQVVSGVTATCNPATLAVTLKASVRNAGDAAASAGLKVAFYRGAPGSGGTLLGVATVPNVLPAGGEATVELTLTNVPGGQAVVYAVADDDGTGTGRETECREDNNSASSSVDLTCKAIPVNQPPVALCRDVTVNANASCQGGASVNDGSYDPDKGPSPLSISESPSTSFPLGRHPVTLTAFDGAASDQCVGIVTVVDTTKPSIDCPPSQVLETCSPEGAPATFEAGAASDNCGAARVSCSHASGTTFPVGETAVTCSARDGSENEASCGFNVTVRGDTTPPVLSCPTGPIVVNRCTTGNSTATFDVSATDNCGPVPVTCSHASGSSFPTGNTPVTCSATDAFGNKGSCAFTVQVGGADPTQPPTPGAELGKELWSPNHKYETVKLSDCAAPATDACGGSLPLDTHGRILRVTSDEVEDANGNGDGRTCEDMVIVDSKSVQLRSEREGRGDGRIYTIHYAVTNSAGATTQSSCRVYVPHDQSGRSAVDSGVKFCVGQGCPAGTTEGSLLCK